MIHIIHNRHRVEYSVVKAAVTGTSVQVQAATPHHGNSHVHGLISQNTKQNETYPAGTAEFYLYTFMIWDAPDTADNSSKVVSATAETNEGDVRQGSNIIYRFVDACVGRCGCSYFRPGVCVRVCLCVCECECQFFFAASRNY